MENRYFSTSLKGKLEYFKERNIEGLSTQLTVIIKFTSCI